MFAPRAPGRTARRTKRRGCASGSSLNSAVRYRCPRDVACRALLLRRRLESIPRSRFAPEASLLTPVPPRDLAALPDAPDDARLTRRELVLVAGFWLGWAVLSVGNQVLNSTGGRRAAAGVRGALAIALAEALCWIVLTPGLFRLAARFGTDRTPRLVRLFVLGGAGVLVAVVVGAAGGELRRLFPPAGAQPGGGGAFGGGPPIGPFGGPPPGGPPGGAGGPRTPVVPPWFALLNALVLYLGVVAAGLARAYARRAQARRDEALRLEAQLAEARLDALRRQLDPHFLFNTLNAVSTLVERDPRGVRRMIARLSELLRHSFEGGTAAEVPLRDELALLGRYVEIMQVRFQGRLTVATRADDSVLDALVPALILQPLVENAIKHGVERRHGPGAVVIEALAAAGPDGTAGAGGGGLALRVTDDGPGPEGPARDGREGVGLRNTVARLEQLYGTAQTFALRPATGGGTVAEVRLPLRRAAGGARVD